VANARGELVVPRQSADPDVRVAPDSVEELDWRSAPPPVQAPAATTADETPVARKPKTTKEQPVRGAPAVVTKSLPAPRPAPVILDGEPPRRGVWKLLTLVLLCAGGIGVGGWAVYSRLAFAEDRLRADAEKDYQGGSYRGAAQKYGELTKSFGRSPRVAEYRFLQGLSEIRESLGRTPPDPADALQKTRDFVSESSRDALFKDHRDALGQSVWSFATALASSAEDAVRSAELDAAPDLIAHGRQAVELVRRVPWRDARPDELDGRLVRIEVNLAAARERKRHVAETLALLAKPKPDLRAIHVAIQRYGIGDDPAIAAARRTFEKARGSVAYERLDQPPTTPAASDGPPSLLLEPFAGQAPDPHSEIVFAVSRGLLHALDAHGRLLWAARVGLDAGDLPVRVPGRGGEPELVLVVGTDPPGLTARDARTGAVRWHQRLNESALGRPVLAVDRLFVATAGSEGAVFDFDARSGVRGGRFATGQPLAAGAAYDAVASRLYVPAAGDYVYVFTYDPASGPRCDGCLTTGHAPGSLRGEPIVVSGEEGIEVPRYLVLGESDGLEAMKLRAFRLIPDKPTAAVFQDEVRLAGWSWFPPYHDAEKLALATDAGAIGLLGIRQAGMSDRPLYSIMEQPRLPRSSAPKQAARAQVVHAEEYGYWVLAGSLLQHWRKDLDRRAGLRLIQDRGPGAHLGAPLHAAQVSADRSTLYLVTQTDAPSANWATAADARTGQVRWQRPLGVTPRGDPALLGDSVLVLDASGALYRFEPQDHAADRPDPWQTAGKTVTPPITDLVGDPCLLRSADNQAVYTFLCQPLAPGEFQLTVWRVTVDGAAKNLSVRLPSPLTSAPALGPRAAVLPLVDGSLWRVALAFDGPAPSPQSGPNWRMPGSRPGARGRVLHWQDDEYLVSDGGRNLRILRWQPTFQMVDAEPPLQLSSPLAGALVRLPDAAGEPTGAVAETSGTLTVFQGANPRIVKTRKLSGTVTAGPWAVEGKLAVVVDRTNLVWLDTAGDVPLWSARLESGEGFESRPQLVDGRLVVADLSGRFVTLDPDTGRPFGMGYRHPAEVAPASSPVPFGPARLFAPLTDGSVILLPLAELERTPAVNH
jgi:outer membrane protein assembly factor BamB